MKDNVPTGEPVAILAGNGDGSSPRIWPHEPWRGLIRIKAIAAAVRPYGPFPNPRESGMTMKHGLLLICAIVALPGTVLAQPGAAPKPATTANCPMADVSVLRSDMGAMMSNMDGMMNRTADPAQKAQMHAMHDKMAMMMGMMNKMGGMGRGMMQGGAMQDGKKTDAAPASPAKPEDHAAHHPGQ